MEKLYLIGEPNIDHLTPNKSYNGTLGLKIYDPNTFEVLPPYYVIECDDGNFRKVDAKYFIPLSNWREQQLNKILE
jgi:hypothetical protein